MISTNPTQVVGIVSFACAALACGRTSALLPKAHRSSWRALAVFYSALVVEIIFSFRHKVHDVADRWLEARGLYGSRGDWQGDLLLLAIVLVATIGLVLIVKNRRRSGELPAAALNATIALSACFVVETISLHGVDAIMYHPIGPLLLLALCWLTASVVVIVSALEAIHCRDDRRRKICGV